MFYVYSFILKCVIIFDKDSIKQEQRKLVFNLPSMRIFGKDNTNQRERKEKYSFFSIDCLHFIDYLKFNY